MRNINFPLSVLLAVLLVVSSVSAGKTYAIQTAINGPASLALDNRGHLFVLEEAGNIVRRIDLRQGTITTVAGNSKSCCYRDGSKATDVGFKYLSAIAIDADGDMSLGDGSVLRKVDAVTGRISTLAGEAEPGDTADGAQALSTKFWGVDGLAADSHGDVFISDVRQRKIFRLDKNTRRIYVFAGSGIHGFAGDGGPATGASFWGVRSLAFDHANNLFIADSGNCRLRRIDHDTGVISTIVITGGAEGNCSDTPDNTRPQASPSELALDSAGNIYFTEGAMAIVMRIESTTSRFSRFAGSGEYGFSGDGNIAINARFQNLSGLAIDADGNVFVADYVANRVRRIDAKTNIIVTIAGNGRPHRVDIEL